MGKQTKNSDWENPNTKTAIDEITQSSESQRQYVVTKINALLANDKLRGLAFANGVDNRENLAVKIADKIAVYRVAQTLADDLLALADKIGMNETQKTAIKSAIKSPVYDGLDDATMTAIFADFPANVVKTCSGNGGRNDGVKRLLRASMMQSVHKSGDKIAGYIMLDSRVSAKQHKLLVTQSDWTNMTCPVCGVKQQSQSAWIDHVVNTEMQCNPAIDIKSGSVRNAETTFREMFSAGNIADCLKPKK